MKKKSSKPKVKEIITITVYEGGKTEVSRSDRADDLEELELIQVRPPNRKRKSA